MDRARPTEPAAAVAVDVSAYAATIGRTLKAVPAALVEGEVQRPKRGNRGVWWFDLTDGDAVLSCSFLPWLARGRKEPATEPRHGDRVRVRATGAELWAAGGRLRVLVEAIEPAGEGEMLRRRAELVARLEAEGLCDPRTFRPLPRFPRAVGVVAGRNSDAMADVLRCLAERYPVARVVTAPCLVQGARAAREVVDRLARLDADPTVDVIVVARGGGSVQDLVPFDDEGLCRAIRAIDTPVVTAIGHTENDPVCNQVTHAAYVPRHAAEQVVPDRHALVGDLDRAADARRRAVRGRSGPAARREALAGVAVGLAGRARVDRERHRLAAEARVVAGRADVLLRGVRRDLDAGRLVLDRAPARLTARLAPARRLLDGPGPAALGARALAAARRGVDGAARTLEVADPRRRGWILAVGPDGSPVRTVADVRTGDALRLHLRDGDVQATVARVEPAAGAEGDVSPPDPAPADADGTSADPPPPDPTEEPA